MALPDPTRLSAVTRRLADALAGGEPLWIGTDPADLDTRGAAVIAGTSGSSGGRRAVLLDASALLASARASSERLGPPGYWLLALGLDHIAGLQVLTRALVAGTAPVGLMGGRFTPAAFADALARLDPDAPRYCSLVPTQVRRLLDAGAAEALASFTAVLVGGAATAPDIAARAASAGVNIVTSYGATETCGGCVLDGEPIAGVSAAIADGRIEISGPVVALGYADGPDPAFPATRRGARRFRTSDLGRLDGGRLTVLGRVDDAVLSGGLTLQPGPVEAVIRSVPSVADAVVVGVPDPDWGEVLAALVEFGPGPTTRPSPEALAEAVAAALGGESAPKRWLLGAIPRTSLGKPARGAARDALAADGVPLTGRPTRRDG